MSWMHHKSKLEEKHNFIAGCGVDSTFCYRVTSTEKTLPESRIVEDLMVIYSKQFPSICPVLLFSLKMMCGCLRGGMCIWMWVPGEARKWHQILWSWNSRMPWAVGGGAETQAPVFCKSGSLFNPWTISPVPFSRFHIQESQSPSFELGPELQKHLMFQYTWE